MRLVPIVASVVELANWRGRSPRPSWKGRTLMKRILLLVTVASMLAAAIALVGVAQAAPTIGTTADAKCLAEAAKTVEQPGFNPADYTFIGGTEDADNFTDPASGGPYVFCGFGGDDSIQTLDDSGRPTLDDRDIFLGGEGNDYVSNNEGTFYGGEGNDEVNHNLGTFYGGAGDDLVHDNQGTFYGGEGNDEVSLNNGIFVQD